jgi:predicted nucleic acid-binding protein
MYSVDTNIMIWGIKRQAEPGQEEMIERAVSFFSDLATRQIRVAIPAQALAEFLIRYSSEDERRRSLHAIERGFVVAPLDGKAAIIAAELWPGTEQLDAIRGTHNVTRQIVKADINVIASAIAIGATKLFSHEHERFRRIAGSRIIVEDLPLIQRRMFPR